MFIFSLSIESVRRNTVLFAKIYVYLLLKDPLGLAEATWWFIIGKRLRARNCLRELVKDRPWSYLLWIRLHEFEQLKRGTLDFRSAYGSSSKLRPVITVWVHITQDDIPLEILRTLGSLRNQKTIEFELILSAPASVSLDSEMLTGEEIQIEAHCFSEGLHTVLARARGRYLVPLHPGHELAHDILHTYTVITNDLAEERLPILYGDQDERDVRGLRATPWFKPKWDPDLFLAQDYITSACAVPVIAARSILAASWDGRTEPAALYQLLLRLTREGGVNVRHVPTIAAHCPPESWQADKNVQLARMAVLADELQNEGAVAKAGPFGTLVVSWPPPSPLPRVTIIVPTRDHVDLLRTCIEGLLSRTDYPNIDLTIVDNGSIEVKTQTYLDTVSADPRVTVLRWDHPYNYSEINNIAVAQATGSYVCLLNNDIEIIDSCWLDQLIRYAVRPDAGAVGAQLLYPDRSIQHAGVVIGLGGAAGHAHRAQPESEAGYFAHAHVAREATAVTAACLVVARDKYLRVGGLDEWNLRIAYNDIDFCLKLGASGLRNYYVPQARLIHHESKSRGEDLAPEQRERYGQELRVLQTRWNTIMFNDPTHHPSLDRTSEIYRIEVMER